jgi:hypothetical protein
MFVLLRFAMVMIMSCYKVPIKLVARKLLAIVSGYGRQFAGNELLLNAVTN